MIAIRRRGCKCLWTRKFVIADTDEGTQCAYVPKECRLFKSAAITVAAAAVLAVGLTPASGQDLSLTIPNLGGEAKSDAELRVALRSGADSVADRRQFGNRRRAADAGRGGVDGDVVSPGTPRSGGAGSRGSRQLGAGRVEAESGDRLFRQRNRRRAARPASRAALSARSLSRAASSI